MQTTWKKTSLRRQTLRIALIVALITIALCLSAVTAGAAENETRADALKELGLFQGSDAGYDLDRAPTRGEVAVTLVRLLGRETEAKEQPLAHPYKDVPDWLSPYIGYLYQNKLTSGVTSDTYGSDDICSAQMYVTFVLRSLGYSDQKGDFSYAKAQEFAVELGLLIEAYGQEDPFLRDDMVAIAFDALFFPMNMQDDELLLESLIRSQAVDATLGNQCLERRGLYAEIGLASYNTFGDSYHTRTTSKISAVLHGLSQPVTGTSEQTEKILISNLGITYQKEQSESFLGNSSQTSEYYTYGWLYIKNGELRLKYRVTIDEMLSYIFDSSSGLDFSMIKSIAKTASGDGYIYTVTLSDNALSDMGESRVDVYSDGTVISKTTYTSLTYTIRVSSSRMITEQKTSVNYSVETSVTSEAQYSTSINRYSVDSVTTVVATGSSVVITPPSDLSQYQESTEQEQETATIPTLPA